MNYKKKKYFQNNCLFFCIKYSAQDVMTDPGGSENHWVGILTHTHAHTRIHTRSHLHPTYTWPVT